MDRPQKTKIDEYGIWGMAFYRYVKKRILIKAEVLDRPTEINTMEGTFRGKKGDYLVIGVMNEKYIVKREIFERTYDRVH